nr:hypothetical protein [uncultured Roseovarius sp.]
MINKFALGFAVVAAIAVAGVDYISQAQALGKGPGEFSISDYTQSVTSRVGTLVGPEPVGPVVIAKSHLPEAPDGWERRSWTPPEGATSAAAGLLALKDSLMSKLTTSPEASGDEAPMDAELTAAARADRNIWEYIGPTGTIRLSAALVPSAGEAFAEMMANDPEAANVVLRSSGRPVEMGEIGGVTYYAAKHDEFDSSGEKPIFLRGYIGNDIVITAYADGDSETLLDLLLAIDYDALNAMQAKPAWDIGSDARPFSDRKRATFLKRAGQLERAAAKSSARTAKADTAVKDSGPQRLTAQGKQGGLFTGVGGDAAGNSERADGGVKRLNLNSDACRTSSVGKFCGSK